MIITTSDIYDKLKKKRSSLIAHQKYPEDKDEQVKIIENFLKQYTFFKMLPFLDDDNFVNCVNGSLDDMLGFLDTQFEKEDEKNTVFSNYIRYLSIATRDVYGVSYSLSYPNNKKSTPLEKTLDTLYIFRNGIEQDKPKTLMKTESYK